MNTQFKIGHRPWTTGIKVPKDKCGGRKPLNFDLEYAKKLYYSGVSFLKIAEFLMVSRNTLARRFDSLGLVRRTRKEAINIFNKTESYKTKISIFHTEKNKDLVWKQKRIKKIRLAQRNKKTKPEIMAANFLTPLGFNFVGDGKFFIEAFCPDFINRKNKLIVEIYGDYWHNLPKQLDIDRRRIIAYTNAGFKTLILWEHELKDKQCVINKLKEFIL